MRFLFDGHTLDLGRRELRLGAEPVALEPLVFDLLTYLVANRDRVVSKEEVLDSVWSGRIVSESALATRIAAARRVIGDSGKAQKLIRTFARKGFRFVGAAREDNGTDASQAEAPLMPIAKLLSLAPPQRRRCRCPTSRRSQCCHSPTCAAIRSSNIFRMAWQTTSSPNFPRTTPSS